MSDDEIALVFPTSIWISVGDKEAFFHWLYSIPGYVGCKGVGDISSVSFSLSEVKKYSLIELVAIFERYDVPDIKQLRDFKRSPVGGWFADTQHVWHDTVSGG